MFMVQGITQKWTQPVAFYFVHKTCPSNMLKLLIGDVVRAVFSTGLNVLATISDQGPTNRGAISELKTSSRLQDDIIYSIDDHKLVHIYDVPHIHKALKSTGPPENESQVRSSNLKCFCGRCDGNHFQSLSGRLSARLLGNRPPDKRG